MSGMRIVGGTRSGVTAGLVALAIVVGAQGVLSATPKTRRASVDSVGSQSIGFSSGVVAISANGRFIAFESDAGDLVAGDTNDTDDIYVRDRSAGTTQRVSLRTNGAQGDGESEHPALSRTGRYVAFESDGALTKSDANDEQDIFLRDRQSGRTELVSVRSNGVQGDGQSGAPAISAFGRFVAFESSATNLVAGDTNAARDIFVRDRATGRTRLVSRRSNGALGDDASESPDISADGRFVVFASRATNLVASDTNAVRDIFVRDTKTGTTRRVSVRSNGAQGDGDSRGPSISDDGRTVAFQSDATNLVANDTNAATDVFVHDRATGKTRRVSVHSNGTQASGGSSDAAISPDGRYVAFVSGAADLVGNDTNAVTDIFVHDRVSRRTRRVSVHTNGTQGDGDSSRSAISEAGRFVAFGSTATTLVNGDTNAERDIFWRGPL